MLEIRVLQRAIHFLIIQ